MKPTWSEQDVLERENRERILNPTQRRAVAEHFADNPEAVKAFNDLTGPEALEMARQGRISKPDYEKDRVYRVTRANRERAIKASGRIRQPKGMNRTEASYQMHLELQKRAGEVLWYKFEGITLKLADDTRYTPDFFIMASDGKFQAHEVKGFWRDDAKVKIKLAAELFPLDFVAVYAIKGGGWFYEHF